MMEELARRLSAAFISYESGYKGIDKIYKQLEDEEVGSFWIQLAEFISKNIPRPSDSLLSGKSDDLALKLFHNSNQLPLN